MLVSRGALGEVPAYFMHLVDEGLLWRHERLADLELSLKVMRNSHGPPACRAWDTSQGLACRRGDWVPEMRLMISKINRRLEDLPKVLPQSGHSIRSCCGARFIVNNIIGALQVETYAWDIVGAIMFLRHLLLDGSPEFDGKGVWFVGLPAATK